MSLFDEAGNVYRLLGKAEDVTGRRAGCGTLPAVGRPHRRAGQACLASARLDLTAGQSIGRQGRVPAPAAHAVRPYRRRLPPADGLCPAGGRGAGAVPGSLLSGCSVGCLCRRRVPILHGPLDLYRKGRPVLGPDRSRDGGKPGHAASGSLFPAVGPELPQAAKHSVGYPDQAGLRAGPDSGRPLRCLPCLWTVRRPSAGERHLRSLAAWYFQQLPPSHQRTALRKALSLEAVLSQLEAIPSVELVLPAPEGAPYHLRCSPLEGMPGVLLVTCRRLPAGTPPPAP